MDWFAGLTQGNVQEFELTVRGEAPLRTQLDDDRRVILERIADGADDLLPDIYELAESDREQMRKDRAVFGEAIDRGAARRRRRLGGRQSRVRRPVGVRRRVIRVPTSVWYGRADTLVPAAHGDWLAARIPGAEAFVSDLGHQGGRRRVRTRARLARRPVRADRLRLELQTEAGRPRADPQPWAPLAAFSIFSITWSIVKLAAFWRGGNSLNVSRNCATSACAAKTR